MNKKNIYITPLTNSKMAYTQIPKESKKQINKAGKFLATQAPADPGYLEAQDIANRWRACHAYPINTFQATLRTNLKSYKGSPIVAQRLKRMPTVIDKLLRHQNMKLSTMQDIAGVRGILHDMDDVNRIVSKYTTINKNFLHEFVESYDYINAPRDEDGYRSIHLVYKYRNKVIPDYDGLKVEIQLRTKLQHIWATAVETMGTFTGQALKTRQGDKEWLDFFALVSSAFAHMENTPPIPRFSHLSKADTYRIISEKQKELGILNKMKSFTYAYKSIGSNKAHTYHLITIDYNDSTIKVRPYDRNSYAVAVEEYNKLEAKMDEKVDIVLVSAGPIETLKKAYPNLFLDLSEFEKILKKIISHR